VRLSRVDDDVAGQQLDGLREHELEAEVVPDEPGLLDPVEGPDYRHAGPPRTPYAWARTLTAPAREQ
jgi:hypothetical protein